MRREIPLQQRDFWGNPVALARNDCPEVIPVSFEGRPIRIVSEKGESWWVAKDVCRVLGIANHREAVNGRPDRGLVPLDDDERGSRIVPTPSGDQEMLCVNESGLYALIFKSRKEEAKRFRKWVTSEVLPQIRKTGTYSLPNPRIKKEMRRLRSSESTAKARCDQFRINLRQNLDLARLGAVPKNFRDYHNAIYRGQFDADAPTLRKKLGLRSGETPLDHMGHLPLAANEHIKGIVDLKIEELGPDVPLSIRVKVAETVAREMTQADLRQLGPGYRVGINVTMTRGAIIDVIRSELAAPESAAS